jgi:(2R)-sulfolactate sulfo-lyase subunit beta
MAETKNPTVFAYRRENGRVGIRNHVVILPLDDLSNSACEKVATNVKGCKAIPHAYLWTPPVRERPETVLPHYCN